MDTRQASCAERLPAHLESRLEDFRSMVAWRDAWYRADGRTAEDRAEDAQRRIDEYPLAVTFAYSVRVDLSTGGPADFLVAEVSPEGDVLRITYHFQDWFDGASRSLGGPDFDAAEAYIRATIDLDSIASYVSAER
jgi:hypothetical protein